MSFQELSRQVRGAISGARVGRPVALRLHAHVASDHGLLLAAAAAALEFADHLFNGGLCRVDVRGSVASGHLVALAEFTGGETALATSTSRPAEGPSIDFLLLGSQGSVSFDGASEPEQFPLDPSDRAADDPFLRALRASLEQSKPVDVSL